MLARFLAEHGMTVVPTGGWLGCCPPPASPASGSGPDPGVDGSARLPTVEFVTALGRSFRLAERKKDVIVSSVGALLASAPERVGEVLRMGDDLEVERSHDGEVYLALRWQGSKGAGEHLKWIPMAMVPVVRYALARLRVVTEPARKIKNWYDAHPGTLYLPERLGHLRGKAQLTPDEAGAILGLTPDRALHEYAIRNALDLVHQNTLLPGPGARLSFEVVERHILEQLSKSMRIASGSGPRPLLLIEWRSFKRPDGGGCPCMFESVQYDTIRNAFRPFPRHPSMFQRLGLDPDGTISGRTHSLRHFLCTVAEAGGLSQEDIAEFRGGTNPYHNRSYDHVPDAVKRKALEGLAAGICSAAGHAP